jgi:hypothetical protein
MLSVVRPPDQVFICPVVRRFNAGRFATGMMRPHSERNRSSACRQYRWHCHRTGFERVARQDQPSYHRHRFPPPIIQLFGPL